MADLTHLRIIFPKGTNLRNVVRVDADPLHGMTATIAYYNKYWNGQEPAFAPDMDILVGIERDPEVDIFGRATIVPAKGLLRGFYLEWQRDQFAGRNGGLGWLVMALRYDILEGPEIWEGDWHLIGPHDPTPFCYSLARAD